MTGKKWVTSYRRTKRTTLIRSFFTGYTKQLVKALEIKGEIQKTNQDNDLDNDFPQNLQKRSAENLKKPL